MPATQAQRVDVTHFLNLYDCPCGEHWENEWCCTCDDRCAGCNTSCSPTKSIELDTFSLRIGVDKCPVCYSTHEF